MQQVNYLCSGVLMQPVASSVMRTQHVKCTLYFSIQFSSVYLYSPFSQITHLSQSALQSVNTESPRACFLCAAVCLFD